MSFLNSLLNAKVTFKMVVCLCDHESLRFLLSIVMKSNFVTKLRFEFGQYISTGVESFGSNANIMKEPILFYV